jgi:Kef-type K+ transport system membrane component KefB
MWSWPPPPLLLAVLSRHEGRSLVLVLAASAGGALLSRLHSRVVLPTVVIEIILGILIGPQGLGIATVNVFLTFLHNFGLVFLFFFAGLEVVEKRVPRASIVRGTAGWGISISLGAVAGLLFHAAGADVTWWLMAVALATTALGTLVPILGDAGILPTPLGIAVLGTGVAGEFWPIVVISVFLTGVYGAATEVALLVVFGAIVALAAATALRARPPRLLRVLQETVHTTGQAAVRISVFVVAALVALAVDVGFDYVLGAFAAGLVVGLALNSPDGEIVRLRLEGIGFGFLIPIYFVVTGMSFDLDSLLTAPGIARAAVFLLLLIIVRGASALLWVRDLGRRRALALALFGATGLPLIVAIVGIGTGRGAVSPSVGASMIGAGMISVLVFPLLGGRIAGPIGGLESVSAEADEAVAEY